MRTDNSSEVEEAVRERYGAAANAQEAALCCPVDYDPQFLKIIPNEVIERDYGCGDPSRYVREGDIVLDLGSGGGKICFIASQIVGANGAVIGVDTTDDMLKLARDNAPVIADAVGYSNVTFHYGQIQDLGLDWDKLSGWLKSNPVSTHDGLKALDAEKDRLRAEEPMIPDNSVDVVVSNCVLNLVAAHEKAQLVSEIFRVLKPGGRIAISDIVSDEIVPEHLMADANLWSGCISGAFHELELLTELQKIGFQGIKIDKWESDPFAVVEGIEFRSVTVTAVKGEGVDCKEGMQAVIYKGPFSEVTDDDGHTLKRGERTAICTRTYRLYASEAYAEHVVLISPEDVAADAELPMFNCSTDGIRSARETKGADYSATVEPGSSESSGGCC